MKILSEIEWNYSEYWIININFWNLLRESIAKILREKIGKTEQVELQKWRNFTLRCEIMSTIASED